MQTAVMTKEPEQSGLRHADFSYIAQELQVRRGQVESVVRLLDEGNTVPFITRYRKERTGGLDEEMIRRIQACVLAQRQLTERKQTVLRSIEGQGKLTEDLRSAILDAETPKRLEDLYLPYKPKKRTLASDARERGLEPLALAVWNRDPAVHRLDEVLPTLVNPEKQLNTFDEVRAGVQHILAEKVAETAAVRAAVRAVLWESGKICSAKSDKLTEGLGLEYKDYFKFAESVRQIPPHRILALNRGERANALKVSIDWQAEAVRATALKALAETLDRQSAQASAPASVVEGTDGAPAHERVAPPVNDGEQLSPASAYRTPHAALLNVVVDDALARLLLPSLENEIRRELRDEAETHAVRIFARNLRSLLLQPPLHGRRVLAIDPGFRTGCKLAALDETGNILEHDVMYPHGGGGRRDRQHQQQQPAAPATPAPPAPPVEAAALPPEMGTPLAEGVAPPPETVVALAEARPPAESAAPPVESAPLAEAVAPSPEPTEPSAAEAPSAEAQPAPAPPPVPQLSRREEAKLKLLNLIVKHNLNVIAIGNGTACRETEELVSDLIAEKLPELAYVIVNEAGASDYSTSQVGREEFPSHDATTRGTISIGRRLQDPLSELVKVDPQHIGVGLYQHDVSPRHLKESLEWVVESSVNQVGVDANTASVPLLRHVSGFNQMVARDLVEYRKQNGAFRNREQLLQVPNIGPARFTQAAGFLKIIGGDNPLDCTWIHPESYEATRRLLAELGYGLEVVEDKARAEEFQRKLRSLSVEELAPKLDLGVPTLRDIFDALARPGRDPREDLPPPVFRKGVLKLEDLMPGMELKGTVLNVVDFGAFVDIGLKDSGLVHISQMANRFIKNPYDVAAVGDVVSVWVLSVDKERHRVSLTMIRPGSERKPPERHPSQAPRDQGAPPPREGRRPSGRPQQGQPVGAGTQQRGGPRRPGGPGRHGGPRSQAQPQGAATEQTAAATAKPHVTPRPAPQPRKPRKASPPPKLSQAALEGKASLRTFAELSAFLAAKQTPPAPTPSPAPPAPTAETPAEQQPAPEPAPAEVPGSGEITPPPV